MNDYGYVTAIAKEMRGVVLREATGRERAIIDLLLQGGYVMVMSDGTIGLMDKRPSQQR